MKIALDAMGGDFGCAPNIEGAKLALLAHPQIEKILLVGDQAVLERETAAAGLPSERVEIVHASEVVNMNESVQVVRRKKDSSIMVATDLVKADRAKAVVSAGHTGAAVAAATLRLKRLTGVDRAGILTPFPNEHGTCYLIDAGANVDSSAEQLVQHAIMGATYVKHVTGKAAPVVGLMSNGEEEGKGNEVTRKAFAQLVALRGQGLNFRGNIEGRDLMSAPVDVAVCDGFVGNVLLKGCEGTAKAFGRILKTEITRSLSRRLLAALLRPAFRAAADRLSYENYGGSLLLGVGGVVVIAHGSSNATAIKNALRVGAEAVAHALNPHLQQDLLHFKVATTPPPVSPSPAAVLPSH